MGKRWFYRMLLSYMPVFLIIVSFVFFVFFQSLSEQNRKEAMKANEALTQEARRLIDSVLKSIDNTIMLDIMSNPQFIRFFEEDASSDVYLNMQVFKRLQEYMIALPQVDSVYLVRFKDQFVQSNATSGSMQQYADYPFIKKQLEGEPSKLWQDKRSFQEFPARPEKNVITLVRRAPILSSDRGMVVVNVSTDMLQKMVQELHDPKVSFIQVVDRSGMPLMDQEGGGKEAKVYSTAISGYTGWYFQGGLANGAVVSAVSALYNVWFTIGVVMTVIGLAWIFYVTRRNYRPIEQIVARLRGYSLERSSGLAKDNNPNVFTFIESAVDTIIDQSNHYLQKHREDLPVRRSYYFHQLLEGNSEPYMEAWHAEVNRFDWPAPAERLLVVVMEIDRYAQFCGQYGPRDQSLLKFALRCAIGEMADKHQAVIWTEWMTGGQLAAITQLPNTEADDLSAAYAILEQIRSWVEHNLKLTVTMGAGDVADGVEDIPHAYKTAAQALNGKVILGENRIITSREIEGYSQDVVYKHLQLIRSMAQSIRLLSDDWRLKYNQLFADTRQNLLNKHDIENMLNYLLYALGGEMSGLTKEFQDVWNGSFMPRAAELVKSFDTLADVEHRLAGLLTELTGRMAELQQTRQYAAAVKDMRAYIEERYGDANLSLDSLSDAFNISPKYISKLFKEETGQKFVDFLIDLRMRHAQRLLGETDASVQDIAGQVGYTSAISFSRAFKKVIGKSPSECRDVSISAEFGLAVEKS